MTWIHNSRRLSSTTAVTYDMHKYAAAFDLALGWHVLQYSACLKQVGAMVPTTWDELVDVAEKFKMADIPAFALGSINRWPGQFWFDMILLRTAGNDYRNQLMSGEASYTDPEVVRAFSLWNDLVQAGYFYPDANAYDWDEAANQVANGEAAMTLMGTWIGGLYAGNDMVPGEDFDYFSFPTIDEDTPRASLGPIDTFVVSADAANPDAAKAFLVLLDQSGCAMGRIRRGRGQPGAELAGRHHESTTMLWRGSPPKSPLTLSSLSTMTWQRRHPSRKSA